MRSTYLNAVLCTLTFLLVQNTGKLLAQNATDFIIEDDQYFPALNWSDEFDWQLLKAVSENQEANMLISPFSLKLALLMLYEGSSGTTEQQLQTVLRFGGSKNDTRSLFKNTLASMRNVKEDYIIKIGTQLFLDSNIAAKQYYGAVLKDSYQTDIVATNYSNPLEASKAINSWINSSTNGYIKELVNADELKSDTILYVANAIFFKGKWLSEFNKENSYTGGFYVTPNSIVNVNYMNQSSRYYYADLPDLDAKILRLAYTGKDYSFFIVLPNSKAGLSELIKNINLIQLKQALFMLLSKRTVNVYLPKFKFDYSTSYAKTLQDFGLVNLFSNVASLPGIARDVGSGGRFLFVDEIKQKSGIEVNEEGSVSYSATSIQLGNKFGSSDCVFNASHPFLFFIEHQPTGTILFAGKVVNPLQLEVTSLPNRVNEEKPNFPSVQPQPPYVPSDAPSTATQATNLINGQFADENPNGIPNPYQETEISNGHFNYFDVELLQMFDERQNWFISPASIKLTLALLFEGARGETKQQLGQAIHLPKSPIAQSQQIRQLVEDLSKEGSNTFIKMANFLFVSNLYKLQNNYRSTVQSKYRANIRQVDFKNNSATIKEINDLVRDHTRKAIDGVIDSSGFSSDTSLIALNALYFKGIWKQRFDNRTFPLKFTTTNGVITAKGMQSKQNYKFKFFDDLAMTAVSIPYTGDEFEMLILLPSSAAGVNRLQRDIQHIDIGEYIISKLETTEVDLHMPLFNIDCTSDLSEVLKALHVGDIFETSANLTGIVENGNLRVNEIIQKAKVEVNQIGTLAAAATIVHVVALMSPTIEKVVVDKPFLFFIYNKNSNNIIFEGRVNQPVNLGSSFANSDEIRKGQNIQHVAPKQPIYRPPNNYNKREKIW